jgi:hypothetical protein
MMGWRGYSPGGREHHSDTVIKYSKLLEGNTKIWGKRMGKKETWRKQGKHCFVNK